MGDRAEPNRRAPVSEGEGQRENELEKMVSNCQMKRILQYRIRLTIIML
jgi:hypothetical protein